MSTVLFIALAVLALLLIWAILTYNGMIRTRNRVDEAWSGIDVQLKRRHDLVPNLVATVKEYVKHERETLESLTAARTAAEDARERGPAEAGRAEAGLGEAFKRLFAVAEAYPQLRASENYVTLQEELANTEDQIAAARRIYNGNVQTYNTKIQVFPNSLLAGPFGFGEREYFELEVAAEREPVVLSE